MGLKAPNWFILNMPHDLYRSLFFIPVLYAAHRFRMKGVIATTVISMLIFLPRALFISPYLSSLIRSIVFTIGLWFLGFFFATALNAIDKQKKIAEDLRESEEKYRSLVEFADDPIYLLDKDCRYVSVNNVFLSRLGLSKNQVIGKTFDNLHAPEEAREFAEKVNQVFETGKVVKYESYNKHLDRWTIRSLSPIKDPHMGEVIAISIIAKDITERKKAEEERLKTEENFREVIENIFKFVPEGLLVFTDKLNLLKENKAFQDIVKEYSAKLNYTEQELREIIIEQVKNRIVKEDHGEIRIAKKQDR